MAFNTHIFFSGCGAGNDDSIGVGGIIAPVLFEEESIGTIPAS